MPPTSPDIAAPQDVRAAKQFSLTADLVRQITHGELPPGSQLPTLEALQIQHGVAKKTAQRSVDQLKASGLLVAQRGRGTFVSTESAALSRIALVFEEFPGGPQWPTFYQSLSMVARDWPGSECIEVCAGVSRADHFGGAAKLAAAMDAHRYGGMIYGTPPFALEGTRAVEGCVLPRVAIQSKPTTSADAAVYPDLRDWARLSLKQLLARGCRRPAIVARSDYYLNLFEPLLAEMQGTVEHRLWWFQAVPKDAPHMATHATLALFHAEQLSRPDSLIIIDEAIIESAGRGLELAGLSPGRDLQVVAYQNRPAPKPISGPGEYIVVGIDGQRVMSRCLELIHAIRGGETVPPDNPIPAEVFD